MRKTSIIVLIYMLVTLNSFGQKVTYTDLLGGAWKPDRSDPKVVMMLIFIDSANVKMGSIKDTSTITSKYVIDNSSETTILYLDALDDGMDDRFPLLIKLEGKDLLKMQPGKDDPQQKGRWNNDEKNSETIILLREIEP